MRILVIGDSWASAIAGDTGINRGWPEIMNIDSDCRQAVAGSTAFQWASDFEGRLTRAKDTQTDTVIISLLGNDTIQALADGVITPAEIYGGFSSFRKVIDTVSRKNVIIILYSDPFLGKRSDVAMSVPILNNTIRSACFGSTIKLLDTSKFLVKEEHFNGSDIHPTRLAHAVIAEELGKLVNG